MRLVTIKPDEKKKTAFATEHFCYLSLHFDLNISFSYGVLCTYIFSAI